MLDVPADVAAIFQFGLFGLMVELARRYTLVRAQGRTVRWSKATEAYTLVMALLVGMQVIASALGLFGGITLLTNPDAKIFVSAVEDTEQPGQPDGASETPPDQPEDPANPADPVEELTGYDAVVLFSSAFLIACFSLFMLMVARQRKTGTIVGLALFIVPFQTLSECLYVIVLGDAEARAFSVFIAAVGLALLWWARYSFDRSVR